MKFDANERLVFSLEDVRHPVFKAMLSEASKVIVGYEFELLKLFMLFPARGHAIMMANSGLGKTKIASILPRLVEGLKVARIDGVPDAMPAQITGYIIETAEGKRIVRQGQVPDNVNFLHIDEATRYTQRLWAALLRMLEERSKQIEEQQLPMPEVFVSVMTANFPAPGQGTVQLPDAVYDRLMFNLQWGYPSFENAKTINRNAPDLRRRKSEERVNAVIKLDDLDKLSYEVDQLARDQSAAVNDYITRLQFATNPHLDAITKLPPPKARWGWNMLVESGGSPRCGMDLTTAAAALALAFGDDRIRPEHVKAIFPDVARAHTKMSRWAHLGKVKDDDLITVALRETTP